MHKEEVREQLRKEMHRDEMRERKREERKRRVLEAKKMAHELSRHYADPLSKAGYSPEEKKARKRVREIKGYYQHLASYISVNLFLLTLNLITSPGFLWCIFPLLGWGIGMFTHTVSIFGFFGIGGQKWEEQKLQELLGHNATKEELARLSQRIDNLVTIISSVKQEELDPDIAEVNESLIETSQSIEREFADPDLRDQSMSKMSKEEMVRIVEDLEDIVTSPEFKFIDQDRN